MFHGPLNSLAFLRGTYLPITGNWILDTVNPLSPFYDTQERLSITILPPQVFPGALPPPPASSKELDVRPASISIPFNLLARRAIRIFSFSCPPPNDPSACSTILPSQADSFSPFHRQNILSVGLLNNFSLPGRRIKPFSYRNHLFCRPAQLLFSFRPTHLIFLLDKLFDSSAYSNTFSF